MAQLNNELHARYLLRKAFKELVSRPSFRLQAPASGPQSPATRQRNFGYASICHDLFGSKPEIFVMKVSFLNEFNT